jgi:4-amino-4-deoxy-L-arabinose transferase-like glycosyltransferase
MGSRSQMVKLIFAVIVGALAVYLIGNAGAPLLDRDEPRYAECSREMLKGSPEHPGSDFVVPRLRGELRTAKPPLVYWCQTVAMRVFGDTAFAARFPSTIAAILSLTLWGCIAGRIAGPSRAAWSVLLLASNMLFIATAKWCTTDAILLVFMIIAQTCGYLLWRGRFSWPVAINLGIAVGIAGLTKSTDVLGVMGMTFVFLGLLRLWNAWRARKEKARFEMNLDPASGPVLDYARTAPEPTPPDPTRYFIVAIRLLVALLLVAAIVAPWLILINQREPSFLPTIIGHDVVKRIQTGLEGHSAPPGYHLLTIWGTYFPWSVLLPMSLVFAWKRRHLPVIRFAFCAVIGPYVMFECIKTKLPHYLLPVFPWLTLLTADVIVRGLRGVVKDLRYRTSTVFLVIWAMFPAVISLLPWLAAMKFPVPIVAGTIFSLGGIAISGTIITLLVRGRLRDGLIAMGVGNLLLIVLLSGVYLQHADFLRASILVADDLKSHQLTEFGQVQMLDYKEPSLVFYQGGTIRENPNTVLTAELAATTPRHLVISDTVWNATDPAVRASYEILSLHPCLNYADGLRIQTVMLVRRR